MAYLSIEDKFANLLHAIMEWSRVNNNKFSEDNDGVN
jgi:hypothetical protein